MTQLDINSLIQCRALPRNPSAVFAVGSLARGWDNELSDYDVTVVSRIAWRGRKARKLPVPLTFPEVPSQILIIDGRRWEIKYWLDSQVDEMFAKVSWEAFEAEAGETLALVETEELFLERLKTCLPISGLEWIDQRRDQLSNSAFRAILVTASLAAADSSVEDCLGQIAAGDLISSVLSARQALGHAVDALLESHGNYGSHTPKWRARRFSEAQPVELAFERYWALETMRDYSAEAPQTWVMSVVSVCRDLAKMIEVQ